MGNDSVPVSHDKQLQSGAVFKGVVHFFYKQILFNHFIGP